MAKNGAIKNIYKKITGKGRVKNHSSKTLWVIENDTKHRPVARKLGPNRKTSLNIDADGFRRVDAEPIDGHKSWWKIWGRCTADIYNGKSDPNTLEVDVFIKFAVPENKFGEPVEYSAERDWGEPIANITGVRRNKERDITHYYVELYGWLPRARAILLAARDKIDNAVVVQPKKGKPYLRSRPDSTSENNFSNMG
jgi:hypothetical protein